MSEQLKVTSIEELKSYAAGTVVELPPFDEGMPFIARLKRPSLMELLRSGKIPNELMTAANDLFVQGTTAMAKLAVDPEGMQKIFDVIDVIAESVFVEPTYAELKSAGIALNDEQYLAVFNYTQVGVKALKPFREVGKGAGNHNTGKAVRQASK